MKVSAPPRSWVVAQTNGAHKQIWHILVSWRYDSDDFHSFTLLLVVAGGLSFQCEWWTVKLRPSQSHPSLTSVAGTLKKIDPKMHYHAFSFLSIFPSWSFPKLILWTWSTTLRHAIPKTQVPIPKFNIQWAAKFCNDIQCLRYLAVSLLMRPVVSGKLKHMSIPSILHVFAPVNDIV